MNLNLVGLNRSKVLSGVRAGSAALKDGKAKKLRLLHGIQQHLGNDVGHGF